MVQNGGITEREKRIALVAHDNEKRDMVEWVEYNWETLLRHNLVSTGNPASPAAPFPSPDGRPHAGGPFLIRLREEPILPQCAS